MIKIIEVKNRKDRKEFLNFPLKMYKDNPNFVPPLYADEKKMFTKKFAYNDTCESAFFLAEKDGKTVGRISAIIQKAANEKNNERRVRFTRFDCIDNEEVAKALFGAIEEYAAKKGMDTICGPLGYSDLEREGLLIEGFDELSTFEEQYNAEYYGRLIEACGYKKEVDWVESKIFLPEEKDIENIKKMSAFVKNRYGLRLPKCKNIKEFIDKYADGFFDLLDDAYKDLYGTVPFSDSMKKMLMVNFKLVIDIKHVTVVLNEKDEIVCLGLCFPSIGKALQKSGGKLTVPALLKVLKAIKKPEIVDLGLIAVRADYLNCGVTAILAEGIIDLLKQDGVKYAETNLNLEDNHAVQNLWKRFKGERHKRRRAYVKTLEKKSD